MANSFKPPHEAKGLRGQSLNDFTHRLPNIMQNNYNNARNFMMNESNFHVGGSHTGRMPKVASHSMGGQSYQDMMEYDQQQDYEGVHSRMTDGRYDNYMSSKRR